MIFVFLFLLNTLMADNHLNHSYNLIIKNLKNDEIDIEKNSNFEIISLPEGILKVKNKKEPSEIILDIKNSFIFDEAIVSVSADIKKGDILVASMLVEGQEFSFGNFSPLNSKSFSIENKNGRMDIDTLKLYKKGKDFKIRLKLFNNSGNENKIKLINIVLTNREKIPQYVNFKPQKHLKLNVPEISQIKQQVEYNKDICSPTSLTMVLNYYGIKIDTITTASNVIDNSLNIYGNWIFNTSFASTKGLFSYVARINSYKELYFYISRNIPVIARINSYKELYFYISRNIPVIASITFKNNELKNSPLKKTDGHLVVIKGFDKNGNIIVNDPAAMNEKNVERVYDKKEFFNAWIKNKYGTSYIIVNDISKVINLKEEK